MFASAATAPPPLAAATPSPPRRALESRTVCAAGLTHGTRPRNQSQGPLGGRPIGMLGGVYGRGRVGGEHAGEARPRGKGGTPSGWCLQRASRARADRSRVGAVAAAAGGAHESRAPPPAVRRAGASRPAGASRERQ